MNLLHWVSFSLKFLKLKNLRTKFRERTKKYGMKNLKRLLISANFFTLKLSFLRVCTADWGLTLVLTEVRKRKLRPNWGSFLWWRCSLRSFWFRGGYFLGWIGCKMILIRTHISYHRHWKLKNWRPWSLILTSRFSSH